MLRGVLSEWFTIIFLVCMHTKDFVVTPVAGR
jgi:hypothetical protein